jgi:hypothetical protein
MVIASTFNHDPLLRKIPRNNEKSKSQASNCSAVLHNTIAWSSLADTTRHTATKMAGKLRVSLQPQICYSPWVRPGHRTSEKETVL